MVACLNYKRCGYYDRLHSIGRSAATEKVIDIMLNANTIALISVCFSLRLLHVKRA